MKQRDMPRAWKKSRKIILRAGAFCLVGLVIVALAVWLDWPPNRAKRLVSMVKTADEVVVYRLQGTAEQLTPDSFPILPYDSHSPTYGKIAMRGNDLETFRDLWNEFPIDDSKGAMCHFPVYGLSFSRKKKVIFQTSLCWSCENFYIDTTWFGANWAGFDSGSPEGRELLQFLDGLLPYDRNNRERIAEELEELWNSPVPRIEN